MGDAERATAYGAAQQGFGGVFHDGDQLVVLFTEDVAKHQDSLRGIVDRPDLLVVRATSRTIEEVQIARSRVTDRLMGSDGPGFVHTVGVAVHEGQFVVEVGIDPYDEAQVERVRAAAAPDEVDVRHQPRPRLF